MHFNQIAFPNVHNIINAVRIFRNVFEQGDESICVLCFKPRSQFPFRLTDLTISRCSLQLLQDREAARDQNIIFLAMLTDFSTVPSDFVMLLQLRKAASLNLSQRDV